MQDTNSTVARAVILCTAVYLLNGDFRFVVLAAISLSPDLLCGSTFLSHCSAGVPEMEHHPHTAFKKTRPCLILEAILSHSFTSSPDFGLLDRSPSPYPVNGNAAIRRTMLANSRRVRWISANSSQ
jgi:hypothetical protein